MVVVTNYKNIRKIPGNLNPASISLIEKNEAEKNIIHLGHSRLF